MTAALPGWALPLAYWLHMLATVVWIGGLVFQSLVLQPALSGTIQPAEQPRFLESLRRRFEPLAWLSLGVLLLTGLTQMSAHPSYHGLLSVQNAWARSILAKHVVILGMAGLAAYQTWFLQPEIGRAALRLAQAPQAASPELGRLLGRQRRSLRWNLVLSLVVLALTALARTA